MHFLLYVFLLMTLLLAVYFNYGNDITQKANLSDFLSRVQNWSESRDDSQHQQRIWPG